jgi:hypothetical protein
MNSRLALITFMDGSGGSPDQSLPGSPTYPSQGLPGLPPGAATLPVFPFDPTVPDQTLPGAPVPGQPLPTPPPPRPWQPIQPGGRFIVKWAACHGLILVPDQSLPPTPEPK